MANHSDTLPEILTAVKRTSHAVICGQRWLMLMAGLTVLACATGAEKQVRSQLDAHPYLHRDPAPGIPAKGEPTQTIPGGTLESYVAYAMDHSPALEAQFSRWQAEIHRIADARRLPDPVISYAYYVSRVETRVGPQRHRVSLKQTFPWPTRLSAGADAASARAAAQASRFDAMAIALSSEIAAVYWRIWEIQASRQVHDTHEAVLGGLSESTNALLMTGRIELADQQQIDLARARVADQLLMLDEQRAQKEAELRGLISAPPDMPIHITSTPDLSVDVGALDDDAVLAAVKSHPRLHTYDALAQSSAFEAKKATAARYPNLTVGVDWIETGKAQNSDVPDSGKDAFLLGIGVSIPLWQNSIHETVAAYHADEKAHAADGQAATDSAVAAFYQTRSQMADAQRRIALYEDTLIPQAESVLESVLGAYTSGRGNVASTLLAQADLLDLRDQHIAAQGDYLRSLARLRNLVGHEFEQE